MERDREMAYRVAEAVSRAGGRAYYVGGFVRDALLGIESHDIDIEVHGVSYQDLEAILSDFGKLKVMGASFGIFSLAHYDLDIAMPRTETARGRGHKDFEIFTDPFIGPEKAAARRDFTMNALMQDVLTGEVLDFYGGRQDMERRLIRHVNDESFAEDPLRVFRGAQFAARFGYAIAPETQQLCRTMDLAALSRERVMAETEKALLKAPKPSVYFETLRLIDGLEAWFPELIPLIGLEQDPLRHPEGSVWNHTMQVIDAAACLRDKAEYPLGLMMAALCHDLGKAVTTEMRNGRIHAYEHEIRGLPIAEILLSRLTNEGKLKKYVLNMVELHMQPNRNALCGAKKKSYMKLFDACVCPDDLILLAHADLPGTEDGPVGDTLREMLACFRELTAQPCVMGKDLARAGIAPGPEYREALTFAHKLHLAGIGKEEALRQTLGMLGKKPNAKEHL